MERILYLMTIVLVISVANAGTPSKQQRSKRCVNATIAFNAYITKRLTLQKDTPVDVVFDGVFLNNGNAYNPDNGIFTAPSAGLYIFTWTSTVMPGKIFDAELLLNGQRKSLGNCNNEGNPGYENCANTVPVILKTGDKVNIRTTIANSLMEDWSSFKGWKA